MHRPSMVADTTPLAGELRVVIGRLIRRLRVEHGWGFGMTQAAVLGRLEREGPESIGDLAGAERVRPQSMSQMLADLEADGLIARRPDEHDGRRTLITLTAKGLTVLEQDRARRDSWLAQALAEGLTDEERALLVEVVPLLGRLAEM
jgi:DNA-binding MarR family transcriptional regulator